MRNRMLLLVGIIVVIVISWIVLANKFEDTVQNTYLPFLKQQQEKGLVEFDHEKIRVHKYSFKITMDNLTIFSKSEIFKTSFEQISIWINPIAENIIASSSGRASFSSGDTQIYSKEPITVKITRTILDGNIDNVRFTLEGKPLELFSAADDSSILFSQDYDTTIIGKLDEKTNLYSLKLLDNAKELKMTGGYFKWSSDLMNKIYNAKKPDQGNALNKFIASYYEVVNLQEPIEYKGSYVVAISKEKLKEIYHMVASNYESMSGSSIEFIGGISAIFSKFDVKKELFNISLNSRYRSNVHNNRTSLVLSSDGKEIRGNVGFFSNSNYKKDEIEKVTLLMSQSFTNIFNDLKISQTLLTNTDFTKLADYFANIKNLDINANLLYKIESSDFDSNFKVALNEYTAELNSQGKDNKSYTGTLKLSDPMKLINAKTKFVHEAVLPLVQKTVDSSKVNVEQLKKLVANVETNGFEVLKVFNNSAISDSFETSFSFEPEKFEFKINDKSLLSIITDDRIVKFLKGFEDSSFKSDALSPNAAPNNGVSSVEDGSSSNAGNGSKDEKVNTNDQQPVVKLDQPGEKNPAEKNPAMDTPNSNAAARSTNTEQLLNKPADTNPSTADSKELDSSAEDY